MSEKINGDCKEIVIAVYLGANVCVYNVYRSKCSLMEL